MTQAPTSTNVNPQTSSGPQPGFVPNTSQFGAPATNPEWAKTLAEYLASEWANGWRGRPGGWEGAKYGHPNPDDTNGVPSPQTILAFSQYAADYKPGMSSWIDTQMPYIPPGPNDYIEDPVTTASRIAAESVDRELALGYAELGYNYDVLDETIKQNLRQNALDKFQQELDRYAIDAGLYESDQLNKIRQYETDAAIYQTLEQIKSNNFATQADIFQGNEANRSANLRAGGSLAAQMQELYDQRTNNAIKLNANPGNFIEREHAVRALKGPTAEGVPGYSNVSEFNEAIRKLLDYEAGQAPTPQAPGAQPTAPTLGGNRPTAPGQPPTPTMPPSSDPNVPRNPSVPPAANDQLSPGIPNNTLNPGQNLITVQPGSGIAYERFDPRFQVWAYRDGQYVQLGPGDVALGEEPIWVNTPEDFPPATATYGGATQPAQTQPQAQASSPFAQAAGEISYGNDTIARELPEGSIQGSSFRPTDPNTIQARVSDIANRPEGIAPPSGTVTPAEARRRWEAGQGQGGSSVTSGMRRAPIGGPQPIRRKDQTDNQNAFRRAVEQGSSIPALAKGTKGTTQKELIIGDPQGDGRPNPELVEITGKNVKTKVTPLKSAMKDLRRAPNGALVKKGKGKTKKKNGIAMYAYGTEAPQVELPSYDDSAYQNLPSLKYLQGGMDSKKYNTLATGTAAGSFGTRIPESGSINYGKYLDIAKDPTSHAMLESIYRSGSRDLASEVARAKARAPFGQAVQTSLIRT